MSTNNLNRSQLRDDDDDEVRQHQSSSKQGGAHLNDDHNDAGVKGKTFITGDHQNNKNHQKHPDDETEEERQERLRREEDEFKHREEEEKVRKRQEQALMFEKYLEESGLSLSFQIIFTELIQKQIAEDQVFAYTAMRLRQIGKELEQLENKPHK